jgi:tetraacyldisaccharide 4'-kinase
VTAPSGRIFDHVALAERLVAAWYAPRLTALTALALPLSLLFRLGVALRRTGYRVGILRTVRLSVPVIVVGNITAGGSGKTPLVAALAAALAERGFRPGIVSRGYGRDDEDGEPVAVGPDDDPRRVGDEPLLLARAGFPVVVARDRVAAGRALLERNPRCNVILSDDGLQHYRLARKVEIAVIDAARGLGNRWMLPAGPLREPPSRLDSVDAVAILTGESDPAQPARAHTFAMRLVGDRFVRVDDPLTSAPAAVFARRGVHALAGIGHPARFFAQLAAMGIAATPHPFRDHHRFVAGDLAIADAEAILMTEKDALKCETFADERCWYLPVQARVDEGLITLVEGKLRGRQAA